MPGSTYSTPLVALDAVSLDLETTGLDARTARAVQIGAVRLANGHIDQKARFETLVNPGIAIPAETTKIHGITEADVRTAPPFADIVAELEAFLGNSIIIGHTVGYDLNVLKREYEIVGRVWPARRALDTRMLAKLAVPTLAHHGLDHVCEWLKVPIVGRHSAIGDAEATARLFLALIPLLRERNVRTLAEAEAASQRLAESEARAASGLTAPALPAGGEAGPITRIDSFPYRHRVCDVMSTPPVFAEPGATVREGIRVLLEKRISSVYVRNDAGELGIVTERDMLRALDAQGEPGFAVRLDRIMSKPLQTVSEDDFIYRAIGRLDRIGFRHLGVRNAQGDIVGAVTTRNLLRHRATTAIVLGDEIDSAMSTAALCEAWSKLALMARSLVAEEVDPRTIAAVISSEIRAMTRRAAQLAEARLAAEGRGPPPVPYAVLVLGSAGRGESLLAADQDNAIVYERGVEGGPEDQWFEALGKIMCQTLHEVGVPLCKGGVMAMNRAWRMSLEDWKATVDGWVRRQRPEDLLNVDIFYDGITAHGETALGEAIWNHAYERGHHARDFIKLLTEVARQRTPPFTLFGGIRVDEKGRIDLKKAGLLPLFTCARVLSIRHDIRARSTSERLKGVAQRGIGSEQEIEEIIAAHRTIIGAILGQQLLDAEQGAPLSPRVNPDRLGKAGKRELARALGKVDAIIDLVGEGRI
jgi:CBS domain-containing protein